MSDIMGRITVPSLPSSGATFPFQLTSHPARTDYPYGMTRDWRVIEHRFGGDATLAVQRFLIGPGARRFHFSKSALSFTERATLFTFYDTTQGGYQTFSYNVPNPDRSTYTTYTVVFDAPPLSIDHLTTMCRVGFDMIEIVSGSGAGPYTVTEVDTRFPGSTLTAALLSQSQIIVPLIHIRPRDPGVPDVYLSDRRVTVNGVPGAASSQLYLPRVTEIGEPGSNIILSQDISGKADSVQFTFGNADRAMSLFLQDTTLKFAAIDLCLFHVGTGVLLQLWKGIILNYKLDGSPAFSVQCSDGLYPLTQNYPRRTITRYCWKTFNDGVACPFSTQGAYNATYTWPQTAVTNGGVYNPATTYAANAVVTDSNARSYVSVGSGNVGNPLPVYPATSTAYWTLLTCDYGYNTANGCLFHGMSTFFGGQPDFPQSVLIKDDGTGVLFGFGRSNVNTTSIVSDSMWDSPLPDIWCNDGGNPQNAFWANAIMASVRDESTFEDTLGILGSGPLGLYEGMSVQTNADGYQFLVCPLSDGFPPQGFQVNGQFVVTKYQPTYGLREVLGTDPVTPTTDFFSLGQGGGASSVGVPNGEKWDVPDLVYSNILTGQALDVLPYAAGTAFVELRYSKSPGSGIAPTTTQAHTMIVPISLGLTGSTWNQYGTRTLTPGLVNNAWVAANTYLRALGLENATSAAQLATLVLSSFFTGTGAGAAEICADKVTPIVGEATAVYLLTSTGLAAQGIVNSQSQTFTYQSTVSISTAIGLSYIVPEGTNYYILTPNGVSAQCQIIQPDDTQPGSVTFPAQLTLPAAVGAGYCTLSSTTGLETQWQFQGTIGEFKPLRDWLVSILNGCFGYFTFEFGKLKVGCRINATPTDSFSLGNMLYQSLSLVPAEGKFEYLKVDFADMYLQYQLNSAEYQDKDFSTYMGRPGAPLTSRIRVPGIATLSQGLRYAISRVREEIGGILRPDQTNPYVEYDNNNVVTFKTTVLALGDEVGDVVQITHPDLPTYPGPVGGSPSPSNTWPFRIQKLTLHKDWSVTIVAKSVTDSMYAYTVGPTVGSVPVSSPPILFYPEPLGEWAPYQIQALSTDALYPSEYTFDVVQSYTTDNHGTPIPTAAITARLPVNQFIPGCPPPGVKQGSISVSTTGGSLPGGQTWIVQICAVNTLGYYSPPSEIVIVKIPSGTNTNQFAISGVQWPAVPGLTGWALFASTSDDLISGQQTGALFNATTIPYTYTPTVINGTGPFARQTYGVPNANITTVRVQGKRLIHGGVEGLLVTGVSTNKITCSGAIDGTSTDNWAGRAVAVIGRTPGNGPAPFASYACTSFSASTGAFTLSTDPSTGTNPVQIGDVIVVCFLGYNNSSAPTVFTDAGLSNITNGHTGETPNDPNRIGNYIRVISGTNRGARAKIVGNGTTSYTLDQPVLIDSTSVWIVEVAAWEVFQDTALINTDPTQVTTINLSVPNYAGLPMLIGITVLDSSGDIADETNTPVRMLWVSGAQGTNSVTASTTQSLTHHTVPFPTTGITGSTDTLAAAITTPITTPTAISLTSGATTYTGTYIRIGAEWLYINSGGGTATPTVTGGQLGTTAATHAMSAAVAIGGALTYQLLPISAAPNHELILQKTTTITNTSTGAGDLNYVLIKTDSTNTFLDGSTVKVLADTSVALGQLHLKLPAGTTTVFQLTGAEAGVVTSGGGGGGSNPTPLVVTITATYNVAPPTPTDGQLWLVRITQDGTGGHTVTWDTSGGTIKFAPEISSAAGSADPNTTTVVTFYASGGNWWGPMIGGKY